MKYFTMNELTKSQTAALRGIDNTPTAEAKRNLTALVERVLDPLRERWGAPITVTSGYRSPRLNAAVGGAKTSQHTLGQAADLSAGTKARNKDLFNLLRASGLPFDQLIDEKGYSWVHVSYGPRARREVLRYDGKKYVRV